mmetsp:Transcript_4807/g.10635  ORF Transcript_4807/g.10635 Transcript_4807/m.10635 type:complete len:379 (+) Transcript_4807:765-1901(+)
MARSVFILATVPFNNAHSISRKQRHLLSLPNTSPMRTNKRSNCSRRRTSTKLVILPNALQLHRPVHSRLRHPSQKAVHCRSDVPDPHEAIRSARAKLTGAHGSGGAVRAGSTIIQFDAVVVAIVVVRRQRRDGADAEHSPLIILAELMSPQLQPLGEGIFLLMSAAPRIVVVEVRIVLIILVHRPHAQRIIPACRNEQQSLPKNIFAQPPLAVAAIEAQMTHPPADSLAHGAHGGSSSIDNATAVVAWWWWCRLFLVGSTDGVDDERAQNGDGMDVPRVTAIRPRETRYHLSSLPATVMMVMIVAIVFPPRIIVHGTLVDLPQLDRAVGSSREEAMGFDSVVADGFGGWSVLVGDGGETEDSAIVFHGDLRSGLIVGC